MPSALQLRPVVKTYRGTCKPAPTNPPPAEPVTLAQLQTGQCFDLGTSGLTIIHAAAEPESGPPPLGGIELRVTLTSADSAGMDRLAAANYQHQIAIVMFGEVLAAPTVNAQRFNGTMIVSGPNGSLDPQTAANVKAALVG